MQPRALSVPRSALVIALLAAALAVVPLAYLFIQALDAGWERVLQILGRSDVLQLTLRSVGLALVVGLLAGLVGTTTAWLVERSDIPAPGFFHVLVVIPLAVPSYVAAYAWVTWWPVTASFLGATAVLTLTTIPLIHLYVTAVLRGLDPAQEEAARSLGRGPLYVMVHLTVPQVRRAIAAGVLLASLYVLADFGAVAIMRVPVFTWVILGAYRAGFDPSRAAVLAVALVLVSLLFIVSESLARGRGEPTTSARGAIRETVQVPLKTLRPVAVCALILLASISVGFPVASYIYWWFGGRSEVELEEFIRALLTTLTLGGTVAVAAVLVALPLAWVVSRFRGVLSVGAERAVMLAHSLPGIVVALSFVYVGVRVLQPIYQRWPLLVLAEVALTMSLALGVLRAAFEQQPLVLTEVGRASGNSRFFVFVRVTLPSVLPAIAASLAIVAITTAKELPALLLLRPAGSDTLSTRLWAWAGVSDDASVAPYALTLIAFSVLPAFVAARLGRPTRASVMVDRRELV